MKVLVLFVLPLFGLASDSWGQIPCPSRVPDGTKKEVIGVDTTYESRTGQRIITRRIRQTLPAVDGAVSQVRICIMKEAGPAAYAPEVPRRPVVLSPRETLARPVTPPLAEQPHMRVVDEKGRCGNYFSCHWKGILVTTGVVTALGVYGDRHNWFVGWGGETKVDVTQTVTIH